MKKKVYVGLSFPRKLIANFDQCVKLLEDEDFEVVVDSNDHTLTSDELIGKLDGAYAFVAAGETVNEYVLEHCPALKIVSRMGVGYDKIDVEALNKRGVCLTITPGANAAPVAEFTVAMMMAAARRVCHIDAQTREGKWETCFGTSLEGKTLGIVGLGHIGKQVVRYLSGFHMNVITYTRSEPDADFAKEYGVHRLSLEEVMRQSDFLLIHTPYTAATYHMINEERLALMKKSAILVNCSRGEIVDEKALYNALVNGQIAGAALDVFEQEPVDPADPLLKLDNVTVSSHTAGMTFEGRKKVVDMAFQNIIDLSKNIVPPGLVNGQALGLKQ